MLFCIAKSVEKMYTTFIGGVSMRKWKSICSDDNVICKYAAIDNPASLNFDFHTHDICEIIFLKKGNISAVCEEKVYKMQKNSLVIFRANVPHKIRIDENEVYERYNILFNENVIANGIFHKLPEDLFVINCTDNDTICDLFKKLDYYYDNFEGDDLNFIATNIIEEIIFNIFLIPKENIQSSAATTHPLIREAMEYINEHYTEPITIDDICRKIGITKSHLHHLFMEHVNISPKRFINIKRISAAQGLIKMGERPSKIYLSCGFNDYGTFFRNYISYFGYAPSKKDEIAEEREIYS